MNIKFKWVGGATWILSADEVKIACDPVLCPTGTVQNYFWFKSRRVNDPVFNKSDFNGIHLWLITHNHEDHIDMFGVEKIGRNSKIITHPDAVQKLRDAGLSEYISMKRGDKVGFQINDVTVEVKAVPAVHGISPVSAFFAGGVNGYILTITKDNSSFCVYVTGDTVEKRKVLSGLKDMMTREPNDRL